MRNARMLLGLFFIFALLLSFQNCAQQQLELVKKEVRYELPSVKMAASICNDVRFFNQTGSKFVFIVDMSASNIGDWFYETVGGLNYYYFDPKKATDANGSRFTAIKYFLDNCGGQVGTQFAVIGFGNSAGTLTSASAPALSCDNVDFGTPTAAKAQLDFLKTRQDSDSSWYLQWSKATNKYLTGSTPNSLVLGVTSYTSATKCAENLLIKDLTSSTTVPADNYYVFFLSDGIPQDKNGTGCNVSSMTKEQKDACYLSNVSDSMALMRTAGISKNKNLRFTGVYYGADSSVPVVLDSMAKQGGTSGAVALKSFSGEQTALCSLFVSQAALEYKPETFMAIDLTTKRKNGKIVADSDMDGIDDETEITEGTDPTNPRSTGVSGVLDGICHRLGGLQKCRDRRAQITCNPNLFNSMGFSDCDYKMLGLDHINAGSWGIDSDKDGLPDIVEIIKGTDPGVADMLADPDADGVTTRDEIVRGTDPFISDANTPNYLMSLFKTTYVQNPNDLVCPLGNWRLEADRVLTAPILAVNSYQGALSFLNHPANVHKLFIYYKSVAQNSSNPSNEYYASWIDVSVENKNGNENAFSSIQELRPADFHLIGEVPQ